jgi:hypothetical protein
MSQKIKSRTLYISQKKRLLKKMQATQDLSAMMIMMDQIAALASQQNVRLSRLFVQMVLKEIERVVKEQAESYNSRAVWILTIVGGAVQMAAGAYGAVSMTSAFNNNTIKTASTIIQIIGQKQQIFSGAGSLTEKIGSLIKESNQGPQTLRQNEIKVKEMRKDQNLQFGNSADGKVAEYLRSLKQVDDVRHNTFSQMAAAAA